MVGPDRGRGRGSRHDELVGEEPLPVGRDRVGVVVHAAMRKVDGPQIQKRFWRVVSEARAGPIHRHGIERADECRISRNLRVVHRPK